MSNSSIYLVEAGNFIDYPKGGHLTFCCQLIQAFPEGTFKLIGITTDPLDKVGAWQKKEIQGKSVDFFPVRYSNGAIKPSIVPNRASFFMTLWRYKSNIFTGKPSYLLTNAPESLMLFAGKHDFKILHFLHGVENPLEISRFWWASMIKKPFWTRYLSSISKADYIAAAADTKNITQFKEVNNIYKPIEKFPTRFDDQVFNPPKEPKTGIPSFVFTGRLSLVKDIQFLLLSFKSFLEKFGEARLLIIGDGELRKDLVKYTDKLNISSHVTFAGFLEKQDIAKALNSAHVFLLTSKSEGWPTALVEAMACGLPAVSTNVSGVSDMITNGINGFVVDQRDPDIFSEHMFLALALEPVNSESIRAVKNYKLSEIPQNMASIFPDFFTHTLAPQNA